MSDINSSASYLDVPTVRSPGASSVVETADTATSNSLGVPGISIVNDFPPAKPTGSGLDSQASKDETEDDSPGFRSDSSVIRDPETVVTNADSLSELATTFGVDPREKTGIVPSRAAGDDTGVSGSSAWIRQPPQSQDAFEINPENLPDEASISSTPSWFGMENGDANTGSATEDPHNLVDEVATRKTLASRIGHGLLWVLTCGDSRR